MSAIGAVAVFCGSRLGRDPGFAATAATLGTGLAQLGITTVYGGGGAGLMGVLADAALAAGGRVEGVIPGFLCERELAHPGLSELVVVETMSARKVEMGRRANAFVVLPGGIGTLDETVEVLTWTMLGLHASPVLICDCGGWAAPMLALFRSVVESGATGAELLTAFEVLPDAEAVLRRVAAGRAARTA